MIKHMGSGPAKYKGNHPATPNHGTMKGSHPQNFDGTVSGRSGYGGPVEDPSSTLDPQTACGAGTFYAQSVQRPDLLFPWATYPWMTIPGSQLRQAASQHNIFNAVPPLIMRYVANPQINQSRSNRLRSFASFRISLPTTGIFSTGGQS